MMDLIVVFVSSAFSWCLLRFLIPILRLRLLDRPNLRSAHIVPTPRGGGAVFVLIPSVASSLYLLVLYTPDSPTMALVFAPLIALPLAIVGLLDDRYSLPASLRYGVQFVTALFVVLLNPLGTPSVALLPLLLLIFAVTAVINFINFMDGLDGLVAGCMSVAITASSIQLEAPFPIWSLVGALLGFLVWNWSPAKVFMGDIGSTFLGTIFASIVLQSTSWSGALALLLLVTPLLGDSCLCVLRRLIDGQRIFQAHRLHLFQRLHQAGWSHVRVSSLYIFATSVLGLALLLGGLPWVIPFAAFELMLGVWLDQHVAVPFAMASRP